MFHNDALGSSNILEDTHGVDNAAAVGAILRMRRSVRIFDTSEKKKRETQAAETVARKRRMSRQVTQANQHSKQTMSTVAVETDDCFFPMDNMLEYIKEKEMSPVLHKLVYTLGISEPPEYTVPKDLRDPFAHAIMRPTTCMRPYLRKLHAVISAEDSTGDVYERSIACIAQMLSGMARLQTSKAAIVTIQDHLRVHNGIFSVRIAKPAQGNEPDGTVVHSARLDSLGHSPDFVPKLRCVSRNPVTGAYVDPAHQTTYLGIHAWLKDINVDQKEVIPKMTFSFAVQPFKKVSAFVVFPQLLQPTEVGHDDRVVLADWIFQHCFLGRALEDPQVAAVLRYERNPCIIEGTCTDRLRETMYHGHLDIYALMPYGRVTGIP